MFQDVPSFIFSYQPIIHSSKKNFQQNPFLISPFQNFRLDPLSKISGTDIYSHSTFSPRSRFVSVLSEDVMNLSMNTNSQEGDPLRGNKIRGQIVASKTCTKFSRISQSVSRIGQSGQRCVYITTVNRDELQPRD